MNCGGAPMSSCKPLKRVKMSMPSYFNAFCIRLVYSGLDAAHSSIAICSISWRPKLDMHQAIPERSISCPISRSSGTRAASSSRDNAAYLLVMKVLACIHLNGLVDVVLLVARGAGRLGLLSLLHHAMNRAIQLRAQRKPDVVGDEDRDLLQLV